MVANWLLSSCLKMSNIQRPTGSGGPPTSRRASVLREYCEQTSLHGWLYMTTDRRIWRYAWTMIVLTSIGVASVFVYKASEEFTKATVVTTIHSTTEPLSEVFFPAVTVCNINQVSNKDT